MRIFATYTPIASALQELGHEVLMVATKDVPFVCHLPQLLEARGFAPDLVLQTESLGRRTIFTGLEELSCPKIFWSIDTHLNLFWQKHYLRLFNGVATPHASLLQPSDAHWPPVLHLAWPGVDRPWQPHSSRRHDVAFVGRITKHRPLRQWLAAFLKEHYNAAVVQDLSRKQMFELYGDSRLGPNESITNEVNFRLLETASCGCLPLTQNVGADQDALLEPDKEMFIYENVLELQEIVEYCLRRPAEAEAMARVAWERVQREHLPLHHAIRLLQFVEELPLASSSSESARDHLLLTLWELYRDGRLETPASWMEQLLRQLPRTAAAERARLGFLLQHGRHAEALQRAAAILDSQSPENPLLLHLAGSCLGLLLKHWPLSRQFWLRQCKVAGWNEKLPESPMELLLLWTAVLERRGLYSNWGAPFAPERDLPVCALECLHLAQHLAQHLAKLSGEQSAADKLEIVRRMDRVYSKAKGGKYYRLGTLSELSLLEPRNWRHSLALALTNLQCCRHRQGLEELLLARNTAQEQGKEELFFRALQGQDPGGLARKALLRLAAAKS